MPNNNNGSKKCRTYLTQCVTSQHLLSFYFHIQLVEDQPQCEEKEFYKETSEANLSWRNILKLKYL